MLTLGSLPFWWPNLKRTKPKKNRSSASRSKSKIRFWSPTGTARTQVSRQRKKRVEGLPSSASLGSNRRISKTAGSPLFLCVGSHPPPEKSPARCGALATLIKFGFLLKIIDPAALHPEERLSLRSVNEGAGLRLRHSPLVRHGRRREVEVFFGTGAEV